MIPLHDDIPSRRKPLITYLLLVANLLAFLHQQTLGAQLRAFLHAWAVIPASLTHAWPTLAAGHLEPVAWVPVLTAMFLHGSWLHLGGNMLFLWIFADNVEDRLGHVGFLLFYLLAGIAATALQVGLEPASSIPVLGASGAIAGVLGAYLVLYPDARVLTLFTLGLITVWRIRAFWFLLVWFGFQALQLLLGTSGGVAWGAHVGGFLLGLLVGLLARPRTPRRNRFADRWYSNR